MIVARDTGIAAALVEKDEDAARIIEARGSFPPIEGAALQLVDDMLANKDIGAAPDANDPSLTLEDETKRASVVRAWNEISPMFWGDRIALDDACLTIRRWVDEIGG